MVDPSGNLLLSRTGKDGDNASVVLYPQGGRIFTSVGGKLESIVHSELINTILLVIHATHSLFSNVFNCSVAAINA